MLNPSKDLKTTQLKFEKAFRGRKHWTGVVGEAPPVEDFKRALSSCDTVVYCGHGAGQNFLNASQLDGTECSAAMLLMGCSSGRLRSGGDFEPSGMALKYLIAGAPAVVANLWDVTDKDTDIVTDTILEEWGSGADELLHVVSRARGRCKLKYMNGAALVVYGLPVARHRSATKGFALHAPK